jgi:hypothetical protein
VQKEAPAVEIPYYRALFGAFGWGVVAFALQVVFGTNGGTTGMLIQIGWILICVVLSAWPTWRLARRRGWPELWKLFLLAAPAFWVLRILTNLLNVLLFSGVS